MSDPAMQRLARLYYWAASEGPGLEHCRLDTDPAVVEPLGQRAFGHHILQLRLDDVAKCAE